LGATDSKSFCVYSQLQRSKRVTISRRIESSQMGGLLLWQFVGRSAIDHSRTSGQPKPNEEEQYKHRTRPQCNALEKINENNTQAHASIVQLPRSQRDITMMLALKSAATSASPPTCCHPEEAAPSRSEGAQRRISALGLTMLSCFRGTAPQAPSNPLSFVYLRARSLP
jgi:hypothetical protein